MRFQKGHPVPIDFPMKKVPKRKSDIVSPCVGYHHNYPEPSRPGTVEHTKQLLEVVKVRMEVSAGIWPAWFFEEYGIDPMIPEPLKMEGLSEDNPSSAAMAVHMDDPMDLGKAIRAWAQKENIPLKVQPTHKGKQFRARIVDVLPTLATYVSEALKKAFDIKYFYGQARPEEVLNIDPAVFCERPDGSPGHPSYPAGHAAAAHATQMWFQDTYKATCKQIKVVETACKHWAMYRTLLGVHFSEDNLTVWSQ